MLKKTNIIVGALLLALGISVGFWTGAATAEKKDQTHVYELRKYTTAEGKLPDLHKRFRDHTMQLFKKHGIKNVIYTTPMGKKQKDNTLVYVIQHKSRKAAKKSWEAFLNDPEWKKVFKESRKDGPIVTNVENHFLTPTDYSPMK